MNEEGQVLDEGREGMSRVASLAEAPTFLSGIHGVSRCR